MFDDLRHGGDLHLVERCLEGIEDAIRDLQNVYAVPLKAFMLSAGASEAEVRDIVTSLWTDCVMAQGTRSARFLNYRGQCQLGAWLKTVAMNELIDKRRRAKRQESLDTATPPEVAHTANGNNRTQGSGPLIDPGVSFSFADAPLVEIMRNALTEALNKCPSEILIMLQLVYINGLTQREVARMWGWSDAKVSRFLAAGMQTICDDTLRAIKRADEWLELRWEDFVELCSGADWSLLGSSSNTSQGSGVN